MLFVLVGGVGVVVNEGLSLLYWFPVLLCYLMVCVKCLSGFGSVRITLYRPFWMFLLFKI